MNRGFVSFVLFLIILIGPVVALNYAWPQIDRWLQDNAAQFAVFEDAPEAAPAPIDPDQWLNDRPAVRDVFLPDALTPARTVKIEEFLTSEDLLRSGEDMPSRDLLALYAAARAPSRLAAYCAEVIATIGQSCDVEWSDASQDRRGDWVISGHLAYLPTAPLGDPSIVEAGQLFSARMTLPHTGDLKPANDTATREELLVQAQDICDRVRKKFGNCVLTEVRFDIDKLWITDLEVLPPDTNPERLDTTIELTVYADPLAFEQVSFDDMIAQIVTPG